MKWRDSVGAAWGERVVSAWGVWKREHFEALTAALWLWIVAGLWFLGDKFIAWVIGAK